MIEVRQTERYVSWFKGLRDRQAQNRINIRIRRLSLGNLGDVKPVGEGVSELRINYGPGYRVYFVQKGPALVILIAGGDKRTQDKDIKTALKLAQELEEIKMAKVKTHRWDAAEYLETEEDMAAYLEAALEDGNPQLIAAALGDIATARFATERSCLRNDAYRFPTFPTFPTSCFSTRNKASFAPHAAC